MTLHIRTKPTNMIASICVAVAYGSAHEALEQRGTAHFLEHVLPHSHMSELDTLGVSTYFVTTKEYTQFQFTFNATDRRRVTQILDNLFSDKSITKATMDSEYLMIKEESSEVDDSDFHAHVSSCVFGNHVLGRDPLSLDIRKISKETLIEIFSTHYNRTHMSCVYVGPDSEYDVRSDAFLTSFVGEPLVTAPINFKIGETQEHSLKKESETRISYVMSIPTQGFADEVRVEALGILLHMAFQQTMQDDMHMSYDASVVHTQFSGCALFNCYASTSLPSEEAISIVKDFIQNFSFTEKDVVETQKILKNAALMTIDSTSDLASYTAVQNIYERDITPEKEIGIIESITFGELKDLWMVIRSSPHGLFYTL